MKKYPVLFLVFSLFILQANAQSSKPKRGAVPLSATAVLSAEDKKYDAQVFNVEAPEPDAAAEQLKLMEIKKESAKRFPHRASNSQKKTTQAGMPVLIRGYASDTATGVPPDNHYAVGNNNVALSVVNSSITSIDVGSGNINYTASLFSFTKSVGLNNTPGNQGNYRFDPKIIYDQEANRFILIVLNGVNGNNYIVVGFSQTNNPDSAWAFYKFYGNYDNDATWFDYPTVAITKDELFVTGNKIQFNGSWQLGFSKSVIYQIRKQDGYTAAPLLNFQLWDSTYFNGAPLRNLFPVKGGADLKGPSQYFLSNRNFAVQNDTIFLVKLPDTIGSANTNLTVTPLIASLPYGVPPEGRQKPLAGINPLATNDGRILGAYIEGNEIQFVSASVNPANGASGLYHGVISTVNTNPTVQANLFSVDTLDVGYPNLSHTGKDAGKNTSIISFDYSGPNDYPGFGALYYDGSQLSDMLRVKEGDSVLFVQTDPTQRWGDYSGSQPAWSTSGTVWASGIFGRKNQQYGIYAAKIGKPGSVNISTPESSNATSVKVYPNPASELIRIAFECKKAATVSFVVYDLQGKLVAQILEENCREGDNILQLNIASFAPGAYILKGFTDKENIVAHRFVKQ